MKKKKNLIRNIAGLLTVFLMMASAAIVRDGRLLGYDLSAKDGKKVPAESVIKENPDGSVSINSSGLDVGVTGYSGPVPVEITIKDGKIAEVKPLENVETPGFFRHVTESGIFSQWVGKTPQDALEEKVDAITGATYSSTALIANVQAALRAYTHSAEKAAPVAAKQRGVEFYAALSVIVMGALIPLYFKGKRYRLVQEILNVAVLGFWAGTFVDYTMMLGVMSNGFGASASLITILLLIVAFIYPLYNRPGHYCAWICPLGSLQELASRCNRNHKLQVGSKMSRILMRFRMALWMALMLCLWTGFLASWIDYELFSAFMVESVGVGMLVAGGVFLLLSFFITRPYCHYVCPTGTLLRMSQNMDNN